MLSSAVCVCLNPAIELVYRIPSLTDEVATSSGWALAAGGKAANVARILSSNGDATLIVPSAATPMGSLYRQLLAEDARLHVDYLEDALADLRVSTVVVTDDEIDRTRIIRSPGVLAWSAEQVLARTQELLLERAQPAAHVVLSGSVPAALPASTYASLVEALGATGSAVYVDASGELLRQTLPSGPELVKVNRLEAIATLGLGGDVTTTQLAERLMHAGARSAVVTDGRNELAFATPDGTATHEPEYVVPMSPTGAGDAFLAGLVAARMSDDTAGPDAQLRSAVDFARRALGVLESGSVLVTSGRSEEHG